MSAVRELPDGGLVVENVRLAGGPERVDVTVEAGRLVRIAPAAAAEDTSRVLLPGFVDLHTHLREPGGETAETIATGTRAAAAGGYTDVFAMANTDPVTDGVERVRDVRRRAARADARVHVVSAATMRQAGEELVDVAALRRTGVVLFSDDGHCVGDDGLVYRLLTELAERGGVFAQHAQSAGIAGAGVINERVAASVGCPGWPDAGEEAVVARDIAIARATGGHLHVCHVSTRRSVDLIRWAKQVGAPVTAEVTPHHLVLQDTDAVARGPALKVNPPLRSAEDVRALREAVADGTIDVVGTDHAPHPARTKARPWTEAAFGLTALETALPIVAGVLSSASGTDWRRLTQVMSSVPASLGQLPRVALAVGSAADLCVVETGPEYSLAVADHHSRSRNTPFDGHPVRHRVVLTMLGGRVTHS
ncbi:dihydroorotase [Jiangella asiatica]|uniref:Dihydroorotase n=1 Tax=Jiangella asiatica TaxID=2530372 RepID=A0A4R5DTY6_9ACTN|nr:dihydroorotase [Jiangella asiatica]TDE14373.1 dihydroorotase [Jiangella asiatica]